MCHTRWKRKFEKLFVRSTFRKHSLVKCAFPAEFFSAHSRTNLLQTCYKFWICNRVPSPDYKSRICSRFVASLYGANVATNRIWSFYVFTHCCRLFYKKNSPHSTQIVLSTLSLSLHVLSPIFIFNFFFLLMAVSLFLNIRGQFHHTQQRGESNRTVAHTHATRSLSFLDWIDRILDSGSDFQFSGRLTTQAVKWKMKLLNVDI